MLLFSLSIQLEESHHCLVPLSDSFIQVEYGSRLYSCQLYILSSKDHVPQILYGSDYFSSQSPESLPLASQIKLHQWLHSRLLMPPDLLSSLTSVLTRSLNGDLYFTLGSRTFIFLSTWPLPCPSLNHQKCHSSPLTGWFNSDFWSFIKT